jgi:hypothetical protein
MAVCLCVGGGGNCNPFEGTATVQDYLNGFGYTYNPNDPLASVYPQIISQNTPKSLVNTKFAKGFAIFAEACLRSRTLLYCNRTPGDGTTPASVSSSAAALRVDSQLGLSAAGIGVGIASKLGAITGGLAGALGAATAGAGIAIGVLLQIYANHAAAVARQANALGTLCPEATAVMNSIDSAVQSGQISQSDGSAALSQLAATFKANTASLYKDCNAFCAYYAILEMQMQISPYRWGGIIVPQPIVGSSAGVPQSTARLATPYVFNSEPSAGTGIVATVTPTPAISSPVEEIGSGTMATAVPLTAAQSVAAVAPSNTGLYLLIGAAIVIFLLFFRK